MPQIQLPIFPAASTRITDALAFERREGQVVYVNGLSPIFTHEVSDVATFRFFTTQMIVNGIAKQGDIAKAFGVPLTTIKRCVKRYRERGAKAFYEPAPKREGRKLTPERLLEVQGLLNQGKSIPEISAEVGVLATTIHKAMDAGRLKKTLRQ